MSVDARLTSHQRTIASRVIAEESARRTHLVVYLSGAHAYGFPSPDSDLDLKAIHVAPTDALLGLEPPRATFDRAEVLEGVEIDYTSNEVGPALAGILRGNGNFLERVLGCTALWTSPELDTLRPIANRALSRRFHGHYRGFATQQRVRLAERPTVKRLLYVLRTASTGIHLLRTGRLVSDLTELADEMALEGVNELIERKRQGERAALAPERIATWAPRLDALFAALDDALAASPLPHEPRNASEIEAWLVELRRSRLVTPS